MSILATNQLGDSESKYFFHHDQFCGSIFLKRMSEADFEIWANQ